VSVTMKKCASCNFSPTRRLRCSLVCGCFVRHPPVTVPAALSSIKSCGVRVPLTTLLVMWLLGGFARAQRIDAEDAAKHWAFQSVRPVTPPALPTGSQSGGNPIDRLLLHGLAKHDLAFSPEASREQLIRRASFGLTGLPPTPEEVDVFVRDLAPDAWERLIDRLLASPHYGERWARHWLDLARYAESDGFEHDALRPHAWRYRDYVVASFNDDKPYDRFLQEQVAGDELWPDQPAALVATGFNLLGPDMVDSADQVQRRLNTLNDMTDTTAAVALGLTFGCARCHDHKSEPFTQRDYYSLQAFFGPAEFRRELPIPTATERSHHEKALAEYNAATLPQQRQIEEIESPHPQRLREGKLAKLSEDAQLAHRTPKEQRTKEQEGTVQETAPQIEVSPAEITRALSEAEKARREAVLAELKRTPRPPALPTAMALKSPTNTEPDTFVLFRGDYNQPRERVQPDFPDILRTSLSPAKFPQASTDGGRRATLARWLTSPENPLTARVMVNRLWQHHFGRGLVATPGDFGTRGARPTHPELLDWLAGEFMRCGWSLKQMHKLILLSDAYRQSSRASALAVERDLENRLWSRQNRVRLEAEAVRDSLLAISGRLNRTMGGPSVSPPIPADITKTSKNWTISPNVADHNRRSLYILARRNLRFPFLETFDAPDSNQSCPERGRSTTAPQSLTLLNSEEVMDAARTTAAVVSQQARTADDQITVACRLILGRGPTDNERALTREFLQSSGNLSEMCRALFNLNAFIYVE
jgi:hypothetical protein